MNQYNCEPLKIGDRFNHPRDGWYEIISIPAPNRAEIKFDNTGYVCVRSFHNVRHGKVRDRQGVWFHHVGERYQNKQGDWYTLIDIPQMKVGTVRFDVTGTEITTAMCNVKSGNIKDFNKPTIFGVGYIGKRREIGKTNKTEAYRHWHNLLKRCYDEKVWNKHPTYKDCLVCEQWHNFSVFEQWFNENYMAGYCLDKDVLVKGNKVYSPETCCFVPNEINVLFTKRQNHRGKLPIGVVYSESKQKYKVCFSRGKKTYYIGYFQSTEKAFAAYKQEKETYIKEVANKWKERIASNVYEAMMKYEVEITD